jgi:hypothetical protein
MAIKKKTADKLVSTSVMITREQSEYLDKPPEGMSKAEFIRQALQEKIDRDKSESVNYLGFFIGEYGFSINLEIQPVKYRQYAIDDDELINKLEAELVDKFSEWLRPLAIQKLCNQIINSNEFDFKNQPIEVIIRSLNDNNTDELRELGKTWIAEE